MSIKEQNIAASDEVLSLNSHGDSCRGCSVEGQLIKILRNLPAVETKYRGQRNTLIFVSSLRLVRKEKKKRE